MRERRDDIDELARHFLHMYDDEASSLRPAFAADTLRELTNRPWYGNVRELRNAIEHAVILARGGVIRPEHLPEPVSPTLLEHDSRGANCEAELESVVRRWASTNSTIPTRSRRYTKRFSTWSSRRCCKKPWSGGKGNARRPPARWDCTAPR